MKDREFLIWIHARLEQKFGDNPTLDFMHKLRTIIRSIPKNQITPNINTSNNMQDFLTELEKLDSKNE